MKQTLKPILLLIVIIISVLSSSPAILANNLASEIATDWVAIKFINSIDEIKPGELIKMSAQVTLTSEETVSPSQWLIDGVPVDGYYRSDFNVSPGSVSDFEYALPFTADMPEYIRVQFETAINGKLCRIETTVKVINYPNEYYDTERINDVLNKIVPGGFYAVMRKGATAYTDRWLSRNAGWIKAGANVRYVDHNGTTAARVRTDSGECYWVTYDSVSVSSKNPTAEGDHSNEDKEFFVNYKQYKSGKPYLIWINLERQKVNVFLRENDEWKISKVFPCASGAFLTPTPIGEFVYSRKVSGWYTPEYTVKPVLYIDENRGIALHSILYKPKGGVLDATMGRPASHGCVRMYSSDVEWIAAYVPTGTKVIVY